MQPGIYYNWTSFSYITSTTDELALNYEMQNQYQPFYVFV
jgi:hypothetical protein